MNFFSPAVDLDRSSRSSLNASTLLYLEKVSKIMLALMLALIICLAAQLGRYDEIAARNSQMLKELENLKLMVEKNQQRIINQVFFSFKVLQQVYFFRSAKSAIIKQRPFLTSDKSWKRSFGSLMLIEPEWLILPWSQLALKLFQVWD
jgi:hypothetical protein